MFPSVLFLMAERLPQPGGDEKSFILTRPDFAAPVDGFVRRRLGEPDNSDFAIELAFGQFVLDDRLYLR